MTLTIPTPNATTPVSLSATPDASRVDAPRHAVVEPSDLAPTPVAPPTAGANGLATPSANTPAEGAPDAAGVSGVDPALLASLPPEARQFLTSILPVFSSGDPLLMLAALSSDIQAENRDTNETVVRIETSSEERASIERAESNERARRAAGRANRLLGNAPGWVKKLITSVVIAASAAATAATGGVAAGLAIAGAVLLIGAEAIGKAAEALGVSPENARFISLGCQIAGAALMAGAGFAGGASATAAAVDTARTTAQTVQSIVSTTLETVNASMSIDQGIRTTGATVATYRANEATTDAHAAGLEVDRARDATIAILEGMRRDAASHMRILASVDEVIETKHRTQDALLSRMA